MDLIIHPPRHPNLRRPHAAPASNALHVQGAVVAFVVEAEAGEETAAVEAAVAAGASAVRGADADDAGTSRERMREDVAANLFAEPALHRGTALLSGSACHPRKGALPTAGSG